MLAQLGDIDKLARKVDQFLEGKIRRSLYRPSIDPGQGLGTAVAQLHHKFSSTAVYAIGGPAEQTEVRTVIQNRLAFGCPLVAAYADVARNYQSQPIFG